MSGSGLQRPAEVVSLTEATFASAIEHHDKVVVDFWASWCAPCTRFAPVFAAAAAEHPDVLFAGVDTETEPGLAAAAKIRALPTLMVFRDELLVDTHPGGLRASALARTLARVRTVDMAPVHAEIERRAHR